MVRVRVVGGKWAYRIVKGPMICSAAAFGGSGDAERCEKLVHERDGKNASKEAMASGSLVPTSLLTAPLDDVPGDQAYLYLFDKVAGSTPRAAPACATPPDSYGQDTVSEEE